MSEPLPTLADLDPADRDSAQQILNLADDATLQALLNAIGRPMALVPPVQLLYCGPGEWALQATRRFGANMVPASREPFFARVPPPSRDMRPWVIPALAAEPDSPSGRRRVAVHMWRAVQQRLAERAPAPVRGRKEPAVEPMGPSEPPP